MTYWEVTTIRARGFYRAQIKLAAKVDDLKWAAMAKAWQDIREQGVSDDLLDGLSRLGALEDLPVLEPATEEELAGVAKVDLGALYQRVQKAALPVLDELYPEGQPDLPPLPVLNRGAGLSWFDEANEWMADKLRRCGMADLALRQVRTGAGADTAGAMSLRQIWRERAPKGMNTWHGITYETLQSDRYDPGRRDSFPKPVKGWGKGSGKGNLYDPDEIEEYVKNRPDRRTV